MKKITFKSLLVTAALCLSMGAWAEDKTYSKIYSNTFTDASDITVWVSGNTGRYTVNHITRTEDPLDMAVAVLPVENGNNGTTVDCSVLNGLNDYLNAEDYKVEFEMNFCAVNKNTSSFIFYDKDGNELVGIYQNAASATDATIKTPDTELGSFTMYKSATQPTTYYKFVITGNSEDGTLMTITSPEGSTNTYKLSSDLLYIGKMRLNTSRYYSKMVFDNLIVSKAVEAGYVAAPVIEITKVNGDKRNVGITCVTDNAVIYYSIDGGTTWSKYTSEFEVAVTTTIQAKATTKNDEFEKLQETDFSELSTKEVVSGETITLNSVSITRTGENTYSLSCDQTGLVCSPAATICYALNGVEKGTYVSEIANTSTSVTINGYGTISAWAKADGYTNSETTTFNAVKSYQSSAIWTVSLTEYGNNNASAGVQYSSEKTEVVDEVSYSAPVNGESVVLNENFYMMNDGGWLLRDGGKALKAQTGAGGFMFKEVTKGQLVIVNYSKEGNKGGFSVTSGNAVEYTNFGGIVTYEVTADCDLVLRVATGTTTYTVGVYENVENVSISSAGYSTFSSTNAVDFSAAEGLTAYTATVSENKVVLTAIENGIVPANTGVILKGAAGDYTGAVTTTETVIENNALVAATEEIASLATETTVDEVTYKNYILNVVNETPGFYQAAGKKVAAGKAYLQVPVEQASAAKTLTIVWNDGETTGIKDNYEFGIMNSDAATYDLSGRKVANPAKGLYIKNGKKFVVK